MALEEVGVVVGPQRGLALAVAADHFLHFAVGVEQALLARPGLGPPAPEGSEEPVAPLTQVGGEEGAQLLPMEEGKQTLGTRSSQAGAGQRRRGPRGVGMLVGGPGHRRPEIPPLPSQQPAQAVRSLRKRGRRKKEPKPGLSPSRRGCRALEQGLCCRVSKVWTSALVGLL